MKFKAPFVIDESLSRHRDQTNWPHYADDYYQIRLPHLTEKSLRRLHSNPEMWHPEMPRIHDSGISAIITPKSPKSFRIAVETLAYYFRREFSYDFCQYCAEEGSDESEHRAYLWTTARAAPYNQHAIIGACCFRKRHYDEPLPPGVPADCYALQWIWFHPYERRQGHLTRALPYFQSSLRPTYCRRSL